MARSELEELYELAEQGVPWWNRINDVERQAEKLERITKWKPRYSQVAGNRGAEVIRI